MDESGLRHSKEFDLKSVMATPAKVQEWLDQSLPADSHSINNAIILSTNMHTPLCIDPQGQADRWIRMMESKCNLRVIRLVDSKYLSTLQLCISSSESVLLEHESGDVEPALIRVLGSGAPNISKDFRVYITSKVANPHLSHLTACKVAVINFVVSEGGLEEQLCRVIYVKQNSGLEAQKEMLVDRFTQKSGSIVDLEDRIFKLLLTEEGGVMDRHEASTLFENIAITVQEITQNQGDIDKLEIKIREIQNSFQRFVKRASIIFFAMMSLAQVNVMYQYSLSWFLSLFIQFLDKSAASHPCDISGLEQNCLQFFFRTVCRSLYDQDRLLFSFLLCTRLMTSEGGLQSNELHFLMSGSHDLAGIQPSPFQAWLPDRSWQQVLYASELGSTSKLSEDIKLYQDEWRVFCESSHQHLKFPGSWAESSPLAKLIVTRALREDRMLAAIKHFVGEAIGNLSTDIAEYSIADCFADSNPCTPIIIIFTPDYDPAANILSLAHTSGSSIQSLALGRGQGPIADRLIKTAYSGGGWILLQHCHLCPTWMPCLQKICNDLDQKTANPTFRLWLSSQMSASFPIPILKSGIKMIYSPPSGLQSTLKRIISSEVFWDEKTFSTCKDTIKVKKLALGRLISSTYTLLIDKCNLSKVLSLIL